MSDTIAPRIIALVATIPARKRSCERLLAELATKQSRVVDGVILVLDGYGDLPTPTCQLKIFTEHRAVTPLGAGNRWIAPFQDADSNYLNENDIILCLDDDIMLCEASHLVENLVEALEAGGGAAVAMGFTADGKPAPPGTYSRGDLIYGAGCSMTVRAKHLLGLQAFSDEIKAAGGPDALGIHGDDDALVSAYLWKTGVPIRHAATGNIFPAPNTRDSSQSAAKLAQRLDPNAQKMAIKKITGWPWAVPFMERGVANARA